MRMTMNNKSNAVAIMAIIATTSAFSPVTKHAVDVIKTASTLSSELPYYIEEKETFRLQERIVLDPTPTKSATTTMETPALKIAENATPSKKAPAHKDGIFSPVVLAAKAVLGDDQLNKLRAKAISMHSDVIATFVSTAEWPTGQAALRVLFSVVDKNGDDVIEEDELRSALQTLGFDWLKEKQVKGIFQRADTDENGAIDIHEFMAEAPKTLKTNLTKLAKKNGGELGFLA